MTEELRGPKIERVKAHLESMGEVYVAGQRLVKPSSDKRIIATRDILVAPRSPVTSAAGLNAFMNTLIPEDISPDNKVPFAYFDKLGLTLGRLTYDDPVGDQSVTTTITTTLTQPELLTDIPYHTGITEYSDNYELLFRSRIRVIPNSTAADMHLKFENDPATGELTLGFLMHSELYSPDDLRVIQELHESRKANKTM